MGDKSTAKETMLRAVCPLYLAVMVVFRRTVSSRSLVNYPVMIKAAGGGGRGCGWCETIANLSGCFSSPARLKPHLGIPAFIWRIYRTPPPLNFNYDSYGNVIHLGERDCSIQRRHQKLLEEAPSLVTRTASKMGVAAVMAAKSLITWGRHGRVSTQNGEFYFMEMNTRIVDNPVTEMITGLDLVAEQIQIAQGENYSVWH